VRWPNHYLSKTWSLWVHFRKLSATKKLNVYGLLRLRFRGGTWRHMYVPDSFLRWCYANIQIGWNKFLIIRSVWYIINHHYSQTTYKYVKIKIFSESLMSDVIYLKIVCLAQSVWKGCHLKSRYRKWKSCPDQAIKIVIHVVVLQTLVPCSSSLKNVVPLKNWKFIVFWCNNFVPVGGDPDREL